MTPDLTKKPSAPAIAMRDARVSYVAGGHPELTVDDLRIAPGEKVALIGPSGAGKTTLVKLINGLVRPESGDVTVLDTPLGGKKAQGRAFRRRVGCVFQELNLIERATVFRNVLCGRLGWTPPLASLFGWFSEADKALAMRAIEETGLADFAGRRVDTLSGGQRQRVAIARALAQEPEILTADEPVSNLDPVLTAEMLALMSAAADRRGATLVTIVHHPDLARRHADRVLGLRDGRIVYDSASGAPLDARAERAIYGRNVPLTAVPDDGAPRPPDVDDDLSPVHVA